MRLVHTLTVIIGFLVLIGASGSDLLGDECVVSELSCCRCMSCDSGALFRWPGAEPSTERLRPDRIVSDQPHIAESAAVVGLGVVQLETDFIQSHDSSGGTTVDNFSYPNFLLRWGVICDWFELRLGWSYNEEQVTEPLVGKTHFDGGDDLYLGAKIAIADQHGILPQFAIFPQMRVPTGADRYSADEVLPGVNIAYGWEIKEGLGLEVNTQINRVRDDADEFHTEILQVANVGWDISEKVLLFSEVFGIWPADARVAKPTYTYHGGFQYFPNDDITIYVHAGSGLNEAADNFFGGIGFAIRTK